MADPHPKMPTGYHRDRMNLPDQPDSRVEGGKGPTNFSPAITGSQDQPTLIFLKKSKVPLHPSTPSPLKQSHWTVGKTGERETLYLVNGLTFRFTEQSTKIPHEP